MIDINIILNMFTQFSLAPYLMVATTIYGLVLCIKKIIFG